MTLARRRRRGAAALALALALAPSAALAFKCSRVGAESGPSLYWPARTVPWVADASVLEALGDPDRSLADARASFAAWEDAPCSDLALPFGGVEAGRRAEFVEGRENANVLLLVDLGWPHDPSAIAVTTSAFDTRNGAMVDADIELNGERFRFDRVEGECAGGDAMDLRNVLTHEVGHVLGLDHPPSTPRYAETTMFASAPACETRKRTLAQDDLDGLCAIYPLGAPTRQCFSPGGPSFEVVGVDDGFGGCTATREPRPVGLSVLVWSILAGISGARPARRHLAARTKRPVAIGDARL